MTGWLFGSILGFYLLTFGLTRLPVFNARPQLLRWIHLGGWGLVLLQLLVFKLAGVSLRGQWADVLPFAGAWLAAAGYFLLRRRQLGWAGKLYFGAWFGYPAALATAYLADRIFFVIAALPIYGFLPTQEYYSGAQYSLREPVSGFLAPQGIALLVPIGLLLEKQEGVLNAAELPLDSIGAIATVRPLPVQHPDSTSVLLKGLNGQLLLRFPHK